MTMIPHSKPSLGQDDIRAATEVLRSGLIAGGPVVGQFERGMAAYLGGQGGVAVNSGTVALELALRAMGVRRPGWRSSESVHKPGSSISIR